MSGFRLFTPMTGLSLISHICPIGLICFYCQTKLLTPIICYLSHLQKSVRPHFGGRPASAADEHKVHRDKAMHIYTHQPQLRIGRSKSSSRRLLQAAHFNKLFFNVLDNEDSRIHATADSRSFLSHCLAITSIDFFRKFLSDSFSTHWAAA